MPPRKAEIAPTAYDEHPLFPVDDGDVSPHVAFIHVTRWVRGRQFFGPVFRADELLSEDQLTERFGGGDIELIARGASRRNPELAGNITRRRRINLPGRPLPLSSAEEEDAAQGAGPPPAAPPVSAPSDGVGGFTPLLLGLMQMNAQAQQLAQQAQERAAAQAAESQRQNSQMMMQFLAGSKADATAMTQLMLQMSNSQSQTMSGLFTAMMANKGGGPEEFAKYAELMRGLGLAGQGAGAPKEEKEESIGGMLENVADAIQGLVLLKGGAEAPSVVPPSPAPPGSAASVVEGFEIPKP